MAAAVLHVEGLGRLDGGRSGGARRRPELPMVQRGTGPAGRTLRGTYPTRAARLKPGAPGRHRGGAASGRARGPHLVFPARGTRGVWAVFEHVSRARTPPGYGERLSRARGGRWTEEDEGPR